MNPLAPHTAVRRLHFTDRVQSSTNPSMLGGIGPDIREFLT